MSKENNWKGNQCMDCQYCDRDKCKYGPPTVYLTNGQCGYPKVNDDRTSQEACSKFREKTDE